MCRYILFKNKESFIAFCFPDYEGKYGDKDTAIRFIEQSFSDKRLNPIHYRVYLKIKAYELLQNIPY